MIVISESLQCLVEVFKNLQFPLHLAKSHGHLCLYCNFVGRFAFNWIRIWSRRSLPSSVKAMRIHSGLLMNVWRCDNATPQEDFLTGARKPLANGDGIKFKGSVEVQSDDEERKFFTLSRPRYVLKLPLLTENSVAPVRVYGYALCLRILSCTGCIGCPPYL